MTGLAERLGHHADARLLVVNCDDLGSSHAANVAVARAIDEGVATSATLMVPCPWAREAVDMLKGRDVGVHLTFTAEYRGYRWRALTGAPSLHDADGFLPATLKAALAEARPKDLRAEARAQIEQALAWGVDVTHLDSHMGVLHFDARFFAIYLDLAQDYRLPIRHIPAPGDGAASRAAIAARGILCTDHMLAPPWPSDTLDYLSERLPGLRAGVTETFAHPVADGAELRAYDKSQPDLRASDARYLAGPELRDLIAASAITPISYRPLRDLMRAA